MLKNLRGKLSRKETTYFKMSVWAASLTWGVFFWVFSLTMAYKAGVTISEEVSGASGAILSWVVPILIVFTCLLILMFMARYIGRKLK